MNNLINRILFCIMVVFSSLAIAGDEVAETVFVNSTTEKEWPDFKKDLQTYEGITPLGNLLTVTLATIAHEYARSLGLPVGRLPFKDFNALFQEQNNLGDFISEEEFLLKARAGRFLLPQVKELAPTAPLKAEESAALQAQAVEIAQLKKKVDELSLVEKKVEQLSLTMAKNSTRQQKWEEKIGGFFGQFNLLQNKVAALGQEQGNFVQTQTDALKKLTAELAKKSDSVSFLVTDLTKVVSGLQGKVALFEKKVNLFEDSAVTTKVLQQWFVIAGAILAILLLLIFWFMTRKFKEVQEGKVSVTAFKEVKDSVSALKDSGSALKDNLSVIEEVVLQLQAESEANKDVVLEKNLQVKLDELNWDNATFKTIVKKKDKQFVVTVTYRYTKENGTRYVMLGGITDQSEPVSLKKVSSVLYKAANDHRLQNENFEVVKEAA